MCATCATSVLSYEYRTETWRRRPFSDNADTPRTIFPSAISTYWAKFDSGLAILYYVLDPGRLPILDIIPPRQGTTQDDICRFPDGYYEKRGMAGPWVCGCRLYRELCVDEVWHLVGVREGVRGLITDIERARSDVVGETFGDMFTRYGGVRGGRG